MRNRYVETRLQIFWDCYLDAWIRTVPCILNNCESSRFDKAKEEWYTSIGCYSMGSLRPKLESLMHFQTRNQEESLVRTMYLTKCELFGHRIRILERR